MKGAANRGGGGARQEMARVARKEIEDGRCREETQERRREETLTWVMGGLGGPGAMKATVEAVALLATTGSLIVASTFEMFLSERTVHTPANYVD